MANSDVSYASQAVATSHAIAFFFDISDNYFPDSSLNNRVNESIMKKTSFQST
jgi:hypothetical protein